MGEHKCLQHERDRDERHNFLMPQHLQKKNQALNLHLKSEVRRHLLLYLLNPEFYRQGPQGFL